MVWISAHSLTCHTDEHGEDVKETTCSTKVKFCYHATISVGETEDEILRGCAHDSLKGAETGCLKHEMLGNKTTKCFCDTNNCNYDCMAEDCETIPPLSQRIEMDIGNLTKAEKCKATCKAADETEKTSGGKEKSWSFKTVLAAWTTTVLLTFISLD